MNLGGFNGLNKQDHDSEKDEDAVKIKRKVENGNDDINNKKLK